MIDKFSEQPLLAAAWLGSSIGSVDMGLFLAADKGLFLSDVVTALPSSQLLGSGIGEVLLVGYLLAGGIALGNDLQGFMD